MPVVSIRVPAALSDGSEEDFLHYPGNQGGVAYLVMCRGELCPLKARTSAQFGVLWDATSIS